MLCCYMKTINLSMINKKYLPKICVSIAVGDPEALKKEINRAFCFGADYVEIRFDYLKLSDIERVIKIAEIGRNKVSIYSKSVRRRRQI